MVPPAMVICPITWLVDLTRTNISDKNWYNKQFFWLNESLNLTIFHGIWNKMKNDYELKIEKLHLRDNFDDEDGGSFLINIEEIMDPHFGLCYAMIPDEKFKMSVNDGFFIRAEFEQGVKAPQVEVSLLSPEDRYGVLFYVGRPKIMRIQPEAETLVEAYVEKSVWKYLPSKRNCRYYSKEDTYQNCKLRMQVDCFRTNALNMGCKCVPEHTHKTHFEKHPINRNACKTNDEIITCHFILRDCANDKAITDECPLPCKNQVFIGQKRANKGILDLKGIAYQLGINFKPNEIIMLTKFNTMDVTYYNEVPMQETYDFIGTVGGSLGLFIGFSYTGFVGQILDHFIRND